MIRGGRRRFRWSGPQPGNCAEEQIANAPDSLFPLTPVSPTPAATTQENWAAVLPNATPFVWQEKRYVGREDEDTCD